MRVGSQNEAPLYAFLIYIKTVEFAASCHSHHHIEGLELDGE